MKSPDTVGTASFALQGPLSGIMPPPGGIIPYTLLPQEHFLFDERDKTKVLDP